MMATFRIMADGPTLAKNAPDVAETIQHPSRLARFVAARLDPKAYLGLHVTVSLTIAALALWLFGAVLEEVLDNATVVRVDVAALDWMAARTSPLGLRIFTGITHLGDIPVIPTIAVVGAWVLWRQRHRLVFVCWLSAYVGGVLVNRLLKLLIHRSRPIRVLHESTFSFPSGHTMAATIGYGMLAYVVATYWRPPGMKPRFLYLVAAVLALAVGVSRIYLGMHFPTDVIGGFAAGTAWLAICVTGTRIARETPAATPAARDEERVDAPNAKPSAVPGASPRRDASRSRPSSAP
jgi:membrane-associated phospholipid phosphatase